MNADCSSVLATDSKFSGAHQLPSIYLGAIIIINCAACLTPIELFLLEVWPFHGFFSLLFFFLVPLAAGYLLVQFLPPRYYRTKPFESSGRLYETLGIRLFKRFVPNGDYINRVVRRYEPGYRIIRDEDSIAEFEAVTRIAERCHLISLLLMLPSASYALMLGWYGFALWMLLPNILLHLYPVMLQRYTRARIERVLRRSKPEKN